MPDLKNIGKILKEERIKRGLSLEDIHKRTKISKEILKNIEENPSYIDEEPYAKFMIKQLIKEFSLPIEIKEKKDVVPVKPITVEKKPPSKGLAILGALFGFFRYFFVIGTFTTLVYLAKETSLAQVKDRFVEIINYSVSSFSSEPIEVVSYKEINRDGKKINDIVLKANADIWLTAYVDGREVILKIRKGEKRKITFCKKIRFETIGNANKLEVVFDNKKVKLSQNRKILHNVFVDSDGIFINGYNIVE